MASRRAEVPLRHDPLYRGAVFPLGMYTVCTARLSRAIDAAFLISISHVFVYVALASGCVVMLAMVVDLVRTGRRNVRTTTTTT